MKPTKFKVGDEVSWESQAAGTWKEKKGKVLAVIGPEENGLAILRAVNPGVEFNTGVKFTYRSSKVRYLVAVATGKNGQLTHYYAPLASVVDTQSDARGADQ